MAIEILEFPQLTQIIKVMFPTKSCNQIYCRFNLNSLNNAYNMSSGLLTGNNYALKRFRNLGNGNIGDDDIFDDELNFSSPSKFLYYNTDKKEY